MSSHCYSQSAFASGYAPIHETSLQTQNSEKICWKWKAPRGSNRFHVYFSEQCKSILLKANQQLGHVIVKRTCYFFKDVQRRRALYLALVQSQFEHCSVVWRPCNEAMLKRFENFQKNTSSGFSPKLSYHIHLMIHILIFGSVVTQMCYP